MGRAGRALILPALVVAVAALLLWWMQPHSGQPQTSAPATLGATDRPGDSVASSTAPEPPATDGPVAVLVGAGDIAECTEGADAETADLIEAVDGIVFTLGDNAYERGTFAEFRDCYGPTWGRPSIKDRTMPVVGNHEYETSDAQGYFRYFGAAAGDPDEGWYAYDAGAWRVYVLNSMCGEVGGCEAGSPQERWLREDLAANPRACVLAMWHHPRFSSGEHGNNEQMADAWRALHEAGAELVLAGHDHSYERFAPQDATGEADESGPVEIVVGTGGRNAYEFKDPKPNSVAHGTPVYGVLRLELRPDGYAFEFLAIPGTTFSDSGSGSCH